MPILKYIFITLFSLISFFNFTFSQSWVQLSSGTSLNLNTIYFLNVNTGFAGGDDGLILKTTDGGLSWQAYNTLIGRPISAIQFIDINTGFAATTNKVLKTTNSGITWDTSIAGGGKSISFISNNIGYSLRQISMPVLWKTTNSGASWDSVSFIPVPIGPVNKINFKNENTGYACGNIYTLSFMVYNAFIMKSVNNGINWGTGYYGTTTLGGATIWDVCLVGNSAFACGYEGPVSNFYKSTNDGVSWSLIPLLYRMYSVKFINQNKGWFCGINGKILYTDNAGSNIYEQNSGTSAALNQIYMIDSNTGFIAGAGGTILKTTNGGITGLIQTGEFIPVNFELYQNYPNPFNPVTNIKFSISGDSVTQTFLSVYDILGNEIAVLVNQKLKRGIYETDWDASNYPSGVYLYKLQAGDFTETKKMVIIK